MNDRPQRTGRIIGFDVGTRRVGVAISDELAIIATPTDTIHIPSNISTQATAEKLAETARERGAMRVVVGLPRNMKGDRGVQAQWTEEIVRMLRQSLREDHIPVAVYDERLTSVAAQAAMGERAPRQRRGSKEEKGARSIDARAATLILQGYLDRRAHREESVDAEEDNP